jgi:hypothetical protein
LIGVEVFELFICFKGHFTGGSNPPAKEGHMVPLHNAKRAIGTFLERSHRLMYCWVVRAALLSLGVWSAYPQPNTLS